MHVPIINQRDRQVVASLQQKLKAKSARLVDAERRIEALTAALEASQKELQDEKRRRTTTTSTTSTSTGTSTSTACTNANAIDGGNGNGNGRGGAWAAVARAGKDGMPSYEALTAAEEAAGVVGVLSHSDLFGG
jgi:hypothetical protein